METLTRWQDPTIEQQKKEIDRLNNIINELEQWLKSVDTVVNEDNISYIEYNLILDKLQELKENV